MADKMIRACGYDWAYCDGECGSCMEPNIIATNNTYDYCMANNINGYVYVAGDINPEYIPKIHKNDIDAAVDRIQKYLNKKE